jgi:hypothetical protein
MDREEKTRLARKIASRPVLQAVIILGFTTLLALLDRIGNSSAAGTETMNSSWILMTTAVLFYAVCCSVLSLWAEKPGRYWRDGILAFAGLMIACGAVATVLSGQTIDEAGSFRWLFLVMTIGFLVFAVIVRMIRRIVEIVIRQDEKMRNE